MCMRTTSPAARGVTVPRSGSIVALTASVVAHLSVDDSPASIVAGLADRVAVGANGSGSSGGVVVVTVTVMVALAGVQLVPLAPLAVSV